MDIDTNELLAFALCTNESEEKADAERRSSLFLAAELTSCFAVAFRSALIKTRPLFEAFCQMMSRCGALKVESDPPFLTQGACVFTGVPRGAGFVKCNTRSSAVCVLTT